MISNIKLILLMILGLQKRNQENDLTLPIKYNSEFKINEIQLKKLQMKTKNLYINRNNF